MNLVTNIYWAPLNPFIFIFQSYLRYVIGACIGNEMPQSMCAYFKATRFFIQII